MPSRRHDVERTLVGRKPDGSNEGPSGRVRILPLPSIGHFHADREIRRVLIEVPPSCPLRADDIAWAFSGLRVPVGDTSDRITLMPADNAEGMLAHYGLGRAHCCWRTVTPVVLPEAGARRRIDPLHKTEEAKGGRERAVECARAAGAVVPALRHAGVPVRPVAIQVRREPFESNGERAELFAKGTRFSKHRLWHVELGFAGGITGPLAIGDGRFLGLGIMAPLEGEE